MVVCRLFVTARGVVLWAHQWMITSMGYLRGARERRAGQPRCVPPSSPRPKRWPRPNELSTPVPNACLQAVPRLVVAAPLT